MEKENYLDNNNAKKNIRKILYESLVGIDIKRDIFIYFFFEAAI